MITTSCSARSTRSTTARVKGMRYQALLQGDDPPPANPLKDLIGGIVEDPPAGLSLFSIED